MTDKSVDEILDEMLECGIPDCLACKRRIDEAKTQLRELVMGKIPKGFNGTAKDCHGLHFYDGHNYAISETTKAIEEVFGC